MTPRQSRAVFLAGTQRAIEKLRQRFEAYKSVLGADSASVPEYLAGCLAKLVEDDRAQAFVEFAASAPAQLDRLIEALLEAFAHSATPESTKQALSKIKQYCESLRQSTKLLRAAFSTSLFEAADSNFGLMGREERLQFLGRLEQAAVMIEQFDVVIDQHLFATPKTRKQRGKQGARTLFIIMMAEVFEEQFGKPHNELVADLADVLFEGVEDDVTGDSVRTANRRWQKRKLKTSEPKLQISTSDELKPYEGVIRSALERRLKK